MKVRLHNNDSKAAEATDNTIKMLPGGGKLKRNEKNEIIFDDEGLATVECNDPGFLTFALKNQGYVLEVI